MTWKSAARFPGILGTIAFAVYVAWNIRWLAQGSLPPSILIGLFGIPAPTTGMTRSTLALIDGNWKTAFLWNPLTPAFFLLLIWTMVELVMKLTKRKRLILSRRLSFSWAGILSTAWIIKFALGPQWW